MAPTELLTLAMDLIRRPSVSPLDAGCQALIGDHLQRLGFSLRHLPYGKVSNLWATRGEGKPLLVFAGHTDVVPAGEAGFWETDPFEPAVMDGVLRGRGAADMKGSLAAMIAALDDFLAEHPTFNGTLGLLLTSDEESDAIDGTRRVLEQLAAEGTVIDQCIVGEPSSADACGDTMRVGRRGSLNGRLVVLGTAGHVAYPDQADNPIHRLPGLLQALVTEQWDAGNQDFPPTSFQISNIHAGQGATNVVPGQVELRFNFRFSTESTAESLMQRTQSIIDAEGLRHQLEWTLSGNPFLTRAGRLRPNVVRAVREVTGRAPAASTSGGTSDGRFIAAYGTEVVEFGPCNGTIHKPNEQVLVDDLHTVARIYRRIMELTLVETAPPQPV